MLVFEARGLCKVYHAGTRAEVRALDDVSLGVERGSLTALVGPSGSGKTTLLALLGALERPTRGQSLFEGRDLARFSDAERARARRRMGFIFQDFGLIPSLPALDNITYPLIPRGIPGAERRRRALELLDRLGIADRANARARELSGGEQQRVAIARALAGRPEVILADEPTSNLDVETADDLRKLFGQLHAQGVTILLSTHDPAAISLATHRYELHKGKLRTATPPPAAP